MPPKGFFFYPLQSLGRVEEKNHQPELNQATLSGFLFPKVHPTPLFPSQKSSPLLVVLKVSPPLGFWKKKWPRGLICPTFFLKEKFEGGKIPKNFFITPLEKKI